MHRCLNIADAASTRMRRCVCINFVFSNLFIVVMLIAFVLATVWLVLAVVMV